MKTTAFLSRCLAFCGFAAAVASAAAAVPHPITQEDHAAQNLARNGAVSILQAGPFVAAGTFRVQVAAKLGRPDAVLADGAWLYQHRQVQGSEAEGTLVVRFEKGRVSSLALVTAAVATTMRTNSSADRGAAIVARK